MSVVTQVMYSTISTYVEYFIGLLISILIARSLGPADYGHYAIVMWVCALMIMLMNGGITTGIIKFIAEERGKNTGKNNIVGSAGNIFLYLRRIQNIKAIILSLVFIVIGIYYWRFIFSDLNVYLLIPIIFAVYFKASHMFYISAAKGMEKFNLIAKLVIVVAPINLLFIFCIYIIDFKYTLEAYIILYIAVSFFYFISSRMLLIGDYNDLSTPLSDDTKQRIKHHLKIVTVNVLLGFVIFKQSEVAFLNLLSSKENVAYYNIGFTLSAAALLLIPGVYSALLLPIMSRVGAYNKSNLPEVLVSATRYLFFLTMPIVFLGIFYAEFIILFLYGQEYKEAIFPLKTLILSGSILSVSTAAQSFHLSSDRQKTILYYMIVTAIINIVLDYFMIKSFGINGALIANLISTLIISILLLSNATKLTKTALQYTVLIKMLVSGILAFIFPLLVSYLIGTSLLTVIIGTVFFSISYLPLTIKLCCWTKSDLETMKYISTIVLANKVPFLTNMLSGLIASQSYTDR